MMVMYLLISEEYTSSYHLLWVFIISVQGHLNLKNIFVISYFQFSQVCGSNLILGISLCFEIFDFWKLVKPHFAFKS
jgi:hypothetical protein